MTDVVDEERNQLFRELVRTVVVGTVRHDSRHAVCVVESPYEVVAAGFRRGIRRVGIVLCGFLEELVAIYLMRADVGVHSFGMRQFECTVNLIGRNMVETFAFIFFRQRLPIYLGGLQQRERSHHVGARKGKRVLDATVYVAFGSQMDDAVHVILGHQPGNAVEIANVSLYESIVRLAFNILQVGQIARIREFVQIDDMVFRIFVDEKTYHMAADESGSASNDDVSFKFHSLIING